jgi:Xaa-Pro dipeptidase
MVKDRQRRVAEWLRKQGHAGVLFASPGLVRCLSGYAAPIETGPNPFEAGPPILGIGRDDATFLILSEWEEPSARGSAAVDSLTGYPCYDIRSEAVAAPPRATEALRDALKGAGLTSGVVYFEERSITAGHLCRLESEFPNVEWRELRGALDGIRAVKDEDEIALIRRACEIASCGQREVRRRIQTGVSEIALFGEVRAAMEAAASCRLPVLADLVSGDRTAEIGGPPSARPLEQGDLLLVDLVPCVDGYWGDSCNTLCAGEPRAEYRRWHAVVRDALRKGIDAVRPGVAAQSIDAIVRGEIQRHGFDYPHHTGHGIGVTYHEEPRIYPVSSMILEPGMIVALEPGIYVEDTGGVRLEDVVLVTPDGAEILTDFPKELEP